MVVHTTYETGGESGAISAAASAATTSAAIPADAKGLLAAFAFAAAINEVRDDVDDANRNEKFHAVFLFGSETPSTA